MKNISLKRLFVSMINYHTEDHPLHNCHTCQILQICLYQSQKYIIIDRSCLSLLPITHYFNDNLSFQAKVQFYLKELESVPKDGLSKKESIDYDIFKEYLKTYKNGYKWRM